MPRPHELPDELQSLTRLNALEVSHNRFNSDSERLINAIKRVLAVTMMEDRESEPSDHLSIGDTEPTFTGLTFEEMCELLKGEEINFDGLSPDAVSGIKDCVMQFNDSKPSLLHVLWYFQNILWEGDRKNPEASSLFDRLSGIAALVILHPTAGYSLTDDGKRFLLRLRYSRLVRP